MNGILLIWNTENFSFHCCLFLTSRRTSKGIDEDWHLLRSKMYYHKTTKPKRRQKLACDVRRHFIKRLKERYDIEITMRECKELEKRTFKYLIEYENKSRWWYLLKIKGQWVYCLFERHYGLTTVLTPEQFWSSHPDWNLRSLQHTSESFVDAWIISREDQKRYQSTNRPAA